MDLRLGTVRYSFEGACGTLSKRSGICRAMESVEAALALTTRDSKAKLSPEMGRAMGLIWRLGNSLTILAEHKIECSQHLKLMRHGEATFGQKDSQDQTAFKDFELEINVAALLCDRSTRHIQLHEPGHPFDISFGNVLRIECKHPTSEKGIAQSITNFGKALEAASSQGAIVLGMEDVLELAQLPFVTTSQEILRFAQSRLEGVLDTRLKGWMANYAAQSRILSLFLTATVPTFINEGDTTSFSLVPLNLHVPPKAPVNTTLDPILQELVVAMR